MQNNGLVLVVLLAIKYSAVLRGFYVAPFRCLLREIV